MGDPERLSVSKDIHVSCVNRGSSISHRPRDNDWCLSVTRQSVGQPQSSGGVPYWPDVI